MIMLAVCLQTFDQFFFYKFNSIEIVLPNEYTTANLTGLFSIEVFFSHQVSVNHKIRSIFGFWFMFSYLIQNWKLKFKFYLIVPWGFQHDIGNLSRKKETHGTWMCFFSRISFSWCPDPAVPSRIPLQMIHRQDLHQQKEKED